MSINQVKNIKLRFVFCCFMFSITGVIFVLSLIPLNINFSFWQYQTYLVGIILLLILSYSIFFLNKNIQKKDGKLLSSYMTPVYKFFVPLALLICLIANNLLLICKWFCPEDLPIFICFNIIIVIFLFFPDYRLKTLYVVGNSVIVSNFFKEKTYQFSEIVELKSKKLYLYQLDVYQDGKILKYKIMPHSSEEVGKNCLLIESTDIEDFVKKLDKVIKSNRKRLGITGKLHQFK